MTYSVASLIGMPSNSSKHTNWIFIFLINYFPNITGKTINNSKYALLYLLNNDGKLIWFLTKLVSVHDFTNNIIPTFAAFTIGNQIHRDSSCGMWKVCSSMQIQFACCILMQSPKSVWYWTTIKWIYEWKLQAGNGITVFAHVTWKLRYMI